MEIPAVSSLPLATLLLGISWLVFKAFYNYFLHPLSHVPGPFMAKFTTKWLSIKDHYGVRTATLHDCHMKYGPVIRVAPDELVFSDPAIIKQIYGFNPSYEKSAFYSGFEEPGRPVLFTLRDKAQHRNRRKLMSTAFSKSTIDSAEPLVIAQVEKLVSYLNARENPTINVYAWFRSFTVDVISSLYMGAAIGALDLDGPHPYMENIDAYFQIAGWKWQIPWLFYLATWFPLPRWQYFLKAQERVYDYGRASFNDYLNRYGRNSGRNDALKKIMQGDKDLPPLEDAQICSEVGSVLVAGTDTTATTLTYIAWELAKDKDLQGQLRQELKDLDIHVDGSGEIPPYKIVDALPLLNGVILEGLRLHGPAVGSLPRLAPAGGATIGGVFVPGGTTVSMQAYTIHHNEKIFSDADAFRPERWADGGTSEMREASLQWSNGARMCPGRFLATMELKLAIASLVSGWNIGIGERMQEDTMDMVDHFVLMPKGNFCDLTFRKIKARRS